MTTLKDILKTKGYRLPRLPDSPGVYVLSDVASGRVLYIGRSKQLCRRIAHLSALQKDKTNRAGYSHIKAGCVVKHQKTGHDVIVRWKVTATEEQAKTLEKKLLKDNQPEWNGQQCKARLRPCSKRMCRAKRRPTL